MTTEIAAPTLSAAPKIVTLEIFKSGYTVDGRAITPTYARHLAESTAYLQSTRAFKVAALFGHGTQCEDIPQDAYGHVTAFRWDEPTQKVLADVEMGAELLAKYQSGEVNQWSVGIKDSESFTEKGELLGPVIYHLAFLGREPAALPELEEVARTFAAKSDKPGLLKRLVSMAETFISTFKLRNNGKTIFKSMEYDMDEKQMEAVEACETALMAFKDAWGALKSALGAEGDDEMEAEGKPAEGEEKVDEKEANYKAMQTRLLTLESERVKSTFAANGYPADMLPKFLKSVTALGLDETVQMFSSFNLPKPPSGGQLHAGTLSDGLSDAERGDKTRYEYYSGMGMTIDAELQALAKAKGWIK